MMKKNIPGYLIKTPEQIKLQWQQLLKLDMKRRLKGLRALGNDIEMNYQKDRLSIEELHLYIDIMRQVIRAVSFPIKSSRFLARLVNELHEKTGDINAEIVLKKNFKTTTFSNYVGIADICHSETFLTMDPTSQSLLTLINDRKCHIFSVETDGAYDVQFRVVNAKNPILSEKEIPYVIDSTETSFIYVPTGQIIIGDLIGLQDMDDKQVSVEPGYYKVMTYLFHIPKKLASFYIVLCPCENSTNLIFSKVYQFENFPEI